MRKMINFVDDRTGRAFQYTTEDISGYVMPEVEIEVSHNFNEFKAKVSVTADSFDSRRGIDISMKLESLGGKNIEDNFLSAISVPEFDFIESLVSIALGRSSAKTNASFIHWTQRCLTQEFLPKLFTAGYSVKNSKGEWVNDVIGYTK